MTLAVTPANAMRMATLAVMFELDHGQIVFAQSAPSTWVRDAALTTWFGPLTPA